MTKQVFQAPQTATRIIAINVGTAEVLNKDLELTNIFGKFKVITLQVLSPTKLTHYSKLGVKKAVLPLDDILKISFTFNEDCNQPKFIDIAASSLCQELQNDKYRFNTRGPIDFSKSFIKFNTQPATGGWLLLQFTYEK